MRKIHVNSRKYNNWFIAWLLQPGALAGLGLGIVLLISVYPVKSAAYAQIPTGSIPTVTGTPVGAIVTVLENEQGQAYVRSGPGTVYYDIIGYLVPGQQAPALGRSAGGDWILIAYPGTPGGVGWIYKYLVEVQGGLPIVEPPPTSTPQVTATIDPTLAAQFLVEIPPTRLPTYTPPPPVMAPTLAADAPVTSSSRLPMGFVIFGLGVVGIFGALISLLRGR